uniref:Uncharacterized protein n=1 Tax=Anguilla anguilla TaxID=7936 RepID=A0A0E9R7D0_ANGAN
MNRQSIPTSGSAPKDITWPPSLAYCAFFSQLENVKNVDMHLEVCTLNSAVIAAVIHSAIDISGEVHICHCV